MKKIGIIGIGQYAIKYYLPLISKSSNVDLVAICDIDKTRYSQIANNADIKTYENYCDMFSETALDFVIIATPHNTHAEILEVVAEYGIHAIVEKPLALKLKEANRILESFKKKIYTYLFLQKEKSMPFIEALMS